MCNSTRATCSSREDLCGLSELKSAHGTDQGTDRDHVTRKELEFHPESIEQQQGAKDQGAETVGRDLVRKPTLGKL